MGKQAHIKIKKIKKNKKKQVNRNKSQRYAQSLKKKKPNQKTTKLKLAKH